MVDLIATAERRRQARPKLECGLSIDLRTISIPLEHIPAKTNFVHPDDDGEIGDRAAQDNGRIKKESKSEMLPTLIWLNVPRTE